MYGAKEQFMRNTLTVMVALVLASGEIAGASTPTADQILNRIQQSYGAIDDYVADIQVITDIPSFDIPPRRFTVYVKRPDKVKIESESLVVIPKDVLLLGNIEGHLAKAGRVILNGVARSQGRTTYCLKFFPNDPDCRDRVLLWIDAERYTLSRTELWTGLNRLLTVYWEHTRVAGKYWLPTQVRCEVSGGILGAGGPGNVTASFSGYRINTGLSDELFGAQE